MEATCPRRRGARAKLTREQSIYIKKVRSVANAKLKYALINPKGHWVIKDYEEAVAIVDQQIANGTLPALKAFDRTDYVLDDSETMPEFDDAAPETDENALPRTPLVQIDMDVTAQKVRELRREDHTIGVNKMAKDIGVSRKVVEKALKHLGLDASSPLETPRPRSGGQWDEERLAQWAATIHKAVESVKETVRDQHAQTRQAVTQEGETTRGQLATEFEKIQVEQKEAANAARDLKATVQQQAAEAKAAKAAKEVAKAKAELAAAEEKQQELQAQAAEATEKLEKEAAAEATAGTILQTLREGLFGVKDDLAKLKKQTQFTAEAAVTGAEMSKETLNEIKAAQKSLTEIAAALNGQLEEQLLSALRRNENINKFIEIDQNEDLKATVEMLKTMLYELKESKQSAATAAPPASACADAPPARAAAAPAPRPTTRSKSTAAPAECPASRQSNKKAERSRASPPVVLKGPLAAKMKEYNRTLLGEKKNKAGDFEKKRNALASVPTLLALAQESDQFLPALQLILKGICDVIAGPNPAAEFAVNQAAYLAIDTIKSLLEPDSTEMELVARELLVPLLSVTDKAVQGAKQWAKHFGDLAGTIAALAPSTALVVNTVAAKLLASSIHRDNESLFAAACLGKLVDADDLAPIVAGLKKLMAHKKEAVRHQAIHSVGMLVTVDEAYEDVFCKAFPKLAAEIRKAVRLAAEAKDAATKDESVAADED